MTDKNYWRGCKCQSCDERYTDEYVKDRFYTLNSCHETLSGRRIWFCGKCNFEEQERRKHEAKEAAKQEGGAFARLT